MQQINNFLNQYPDLKEFEELITSLYKKSDIKGMFLCGSRANKTLNMERDLSDFDFFVITSRKISEMQSLHYHLGEFRIEIMLYEERKFCNPSSYDKNLLNKLLNKSEFIFSKNRQVKSSFIKFSNSKLRKGVSEFEMDSMWFKIIWNLLKVKSYEKIDLDLAEIFAMQNYFFIGLFYARMCGEQKYNLSESVKYMKRTNILFWKKYKDVLNKSNKRAEIEKIILLLPNSDYYLSKKSLIELDNFVSPLTVVGEKSKIIEKYRDEMDKLILPNLRFLDRSVIYYSLEGLAGVGKTTFLRKLSPKVFLKFNEISKIFKSYNKIKKLSRKEKYNEINDFLLKCELDRENMFSKNKINLVDRSIFSQIVYNYANFKISGSKGIFQLIKELKKLEKEGFNYPKMVYLKCSTNYSFYSLTKKQIKDPSDKTNKKNFINCAKEGYDFLNKILGKRNSLEIKIPQEREIMNEKLNQFIKENKHIHVNFTIDKIKSLLKKSN